MYSSFVIYSETNDGTIDRKCDPETQLPVKLKLVSLRILHTAIRSVRLR
jgi:hypothetical protein